MKILIDEGLREEIKVGDLVYSECFDSYCIIVKEWSTELIEYEYLLIDIESSTILNRTSSVREAITDSNLELVAKKSELTLTNIGGRGND